MTRFANALLLSQACTHSNMCSNASFRNYASNLITAYFCDPSDVGIIKHTLFVSLSHTCLASRFPTEIFDVGDIYCT